MPIESIINDNDNTLQFAVNGMGSIGWNNVVSELTLMRVSYHIKINFQFKQIMSQGVHVFSRRFLEQEGITQNQLYFAHIVHFFMPV